MTIINNKKTAEVPFAEVAIGEVFFDPMTENYFIRIEEFYDTDSEENCNAVNLCDGALSTFESTERIEKVKAELHISNY